MSTKAWIQKAKEDQAATFLLWLGDRVVRSWGARLRTQELYEDYGRWLKRRSGGVMLIRRRFVQAFREADYHVATSNGLRVVRDVELLP